MFFPVSLVELVGEAHHSVGSAGLDAAVAAVQAGTSQAGFAGKNVNAIAAELSLNSFAIE